MRKKLVVIGFCLLLALTILLYKKPIKPDENFIWAQEIARKVCELEVVSYASVKETPLPDMNYYGFILENTGMVVIGVNIDTLQACVKKPQSEDYYRIKIGTTNGERTYTVTDIPMS